MTRNSKPETTKAEKPQKPLAPVKTEFATVERHHLVSGIFQIMGGKRDTGPLDLKYDLPDGGSLRIAAPYPLRPFDAVLLCVVICKAAQDIKRISPGTQNPAGQKLRNFLELDGDSVNEPCLAYTTNARQLIEEMGLSWQGHKSLKQLEESLFRLYSTTFALEWRKNNKRRVDMFHLMSHVGLEETRRVTIALGVNPVAAMAILDPGRFARIDMDTLRSLNQAQQLMFIALSNAIDPGKKRGITPAELRAMLYGPITNKTSADTIKKQTARAKATAVKLIASLEAKGWRMEDAGDRLWIKRPYYKGQKHREKTKDNATA